MKRTNLKYYIGIALVIVVGSLHLMFFENDSKLDVYLFYNHPRYLTNILYDISNLFNFSLLTYWLSRTNRRVFMPLFYLSLFAWVSYFMTYHQITSLLTIPLYGVIVYFHNKKLNNGRNSKN
jgi:hypothetical protein